MSKKVFGVLITVVIIFAIVINVVAVYFMQSDDAETVEEIVVEGADEEEEAEVVEEGEETGSMFVLDEGMRIDYASNPMVTYLDDEKLILAYEHRAEELRFAPGVDAPLVVTYDGLEFEDVEDRTGLSTRPPGVLIDDMYHKYIFTPATGVMYATSVDNINYESHNVALEVYAEDATDAREFGVYTFFEDDRGGIVLLFNSTDEEGDIVVNRAYASSDDLSTLEVTDRDILDGTLESELYADPNAIALSDGRIALIVMNQTDGARPPHGRQGTIHLFFSYDIGETFVYEGQLMSHEDFEEFDVYSLNDPKIVEMWDGSLRVYVAAMLPDPESTNEDPLRQYKWILVSASGELE